MHVYPRSDGSLLVRFDSLRRQLEVLDQSNAQLLVRVVQRIWHEPAINHLGKPGGSKFPTLHTEAFPQGHAKMNAPIYDLSRHSPV